MCMYKAEGFSVLKTFSHLKCFVRELEVVFFIIIIIIPKA